MPHDSMDNYALLGVLGEGAFGRVYLAREQRTSRVVALKKVRIKRAEDGLPQVVMREIRSMESLSAAAYARRQSRHVVRLRSHFAHGAAVVLVMERMQADLHEVMHAMAAVAARMHPHAVRACMWMILTGVAGIHSQKVLHRDLKPSNLLFSPLGCLKLGDFGLARVHESLHRGGAYSHEVATRWYRAVELLFGSRSYGSEVDVWSCGAIFFELLNGGGAPLFPGHNDIDQLYRVLKVRGTPTPHSWPGHARLPDWGKIDFPALATVPMRLVCHPEVEASAVHLLDQMLTLDPQRRITAQQALQHDYFSDYHTSHNQSNASASASASAPASASASAPSAPSGCRTGAGGALVDPPWHEETMVRHTSPREIDLTSFPGLLKRWQQEAPVDLSQPPASSPPPAASASVSPSLATRSSVRAGAGAAAAAASSSSPLSSSAQLRAMHLTSLEWSPCRSSALALALHQLPAHPARAALQRPVALHDLCPC